MWWPFARKQTHTRRMDAGPLMAPRRGDTASDCLAELSHTAYACAAINAAVCASYPPRLFARGSSGRKGLGGARTRALSAHELSRLSLDRGGDVREVTEHPLITLLDDVNTEQDPQELWELTTLHQETVGSAYWSLEITPGGLPRAIWTLPAHRVRAIRRDDGTLEGYRVLGPRGETTLDAKEVVHFRYPDPRDPYGPGLSPLRACLDTVRAAAQMRAYRGGLLDGAAAPGVILTPEGPMGEDERERLEGDWERKFRRGTGRVLVADTSLKVSVVQNPLGELAVLADAGGTRADIANAFGVPLAYLTSDTNLANLQAAERQHLAVAIRPRLKRRDQRLTSALARLFDPTGTLFFASDDPSPGERDEAMKRQELDLQQGVRSINEIRVARGLDPAPWGASPWLPVAWAPTDIPGRIDIAPESGRGRAEATGGNTP